MTTEPTPDAPRDGRDLIAAVLLRERYGYTDDHIEWLRQTGGDTPEKRTAYTSAFRTAEALIAAGVRYTGADRTAPVDSPDV